jgi:Ubiquitin carboxyl-terminal hydrolase
MNNRLAYHDTSTYTILTFLCRCSLKASLAAAAPDLPELNALRTLTHAQQLPDADYANACRAAGCPWIPQTSTISRRSVVVKWPRLLICHLHRNFWDGSGRHAKICGHVQFPVRLREGYDLKAVIVHTGVSPDTGHYVAYRQCSSEGDSGWWRVSDEAVRGVDVEEVVGCEASLLFYERR